VDELTMAFDPNDAVEFLRLVTEVESINRASGLEDLRFSTGDQWPTEVQQSRTLESRPCLTINKIDAHIRQITNAQRQQRPQIRAHALDAAASPRIAEIITGLTRHIEINSNADHAYDTAFNFQCRVGWGYWRVVTDYIREDSFDQDIVIRAIDNPFTVYFDPNSVEPDGSDAETCLITDLVPKKQFEREYPDAEVSGFQGNGTGDVMVDWVTREDIRIAEYFTIDRVRDKLVMLSDGSTMFASNMPRGEVLRMLGLEVTGDRDSYRRRVMWRKVTALDVLEEREMLGRYIPVVPAYGDVVMVDGKRLKFGMVRYARDPQIMYNFWRTAMTESVAMAPKAKWLMAEGQDEGHENEWARANVSAFPILRYKRTDIDGREAPPPVRLQPEPPPSGAMEAAAAISADLQAVLGMYDPQMGKPSGPKSGAAIRAELGQSETSNFHYFDNLTRSMKHTGRIILDLIPHVYDRERVVRIIGPEGKPDLVTVNQPGQEMNDEGQLVDKILNDVTIGTYDVVMDTGPSFNSRRAEAVQAMTMLLQTSPDVFKAAGDLLFRNMDFPGAEVIADRLAAANPLAQIDKQSDIPPKVQMMIKQLQAQNQQLQQQLQAAGTEIKFRHGLEEIRQEGETRRELMRQHVKAHDTQVRAAAEVERERIEDETWRHDIHVKALTAQNVEELRGIVALLAKRMDAAQFENKAAQGDREIERV
jgi:hypothetical protein